MNFLWCPVCHHGFNQNGNLRRHQNKLQHFDHKALHNAIRVQIKNEGQAQEATGGPLSVSLPNPGPVIKTENPTLNLATSQVHPRNFEVIAVGSVNPE